MLGLDDVAVAVEHLHSDEKEKTKEKKQE